MSLKDQGTKKTAEIVQSLAKWKRYALHKYGFSEGEGIYTDMNAIRQDEVTDNIHSVYVDQWDWEKIISKEERNLDFLKSTVKDIYEALKNTEKHMADQYDYIETILPDEIFFITSQELEDRYPDLTPKEREYTITKEKGAVFIMQIGGVLASGERQDGRSPDYDDWSLNGDLIVYYPVLDIALELSSMGIRVNADALRARVKGMRMPVPREASLPEIHSERHSPADNRRRYRTVPYLYVLPAQSAHRRGTVLGMADGDTRGDGCDEYSASVRLVSNRLYCKGYVPVRRFQGMTETYPFYIFLHCCCISSLHQIFSAFRGFRTVLPKAQAVPLSERMLS